jgi:hypothetical protein
LLPELVGTRANRLPALASATAYAGAAAFLVAAVWYALIVAEVTVASEPQRRPGQAREEWFHTYYAWFASTLCQERYYTGAAIVAFLSLMSTAAFVRNTFARRQPFASFGAQMMGAGAIVWVVGAVVSIGGHRAVGLMTGRGDPIETVNSIAWTIDTINDAFELAGSALLGAGMLALAWAGAQARSRRRAWSRYTLTVGLVLLVTAGAYAAQSFDLVDLLLVIGGAVLLPSWLVWTGRLLRGGQEALSCD